MFPSLFAGLEQTLLVAGGSVQPRCHCQDILGQGGHSGHCLELSVCKEGRRHAGHASAVPALQQGWCWHAEGRVRRSQGGLNESRVRSGFWKSPAPASTRRELLLYLLKCVGCARQSHPKGLLQHWDFIGYGCMVSVRGRAKGRAVG